MSSETLWSPYVYTSGHYKPTSHLYHYTMLSHYPSYRDSLPTVLFELFSRCSYVPLEVCEISDTGDLFNRDLWSLVLV